MKDVNLSVVWTSNVTAPWVARDNFQRHTKREENTIDQETGEIVMHPVTVPKEADVRTVRDELPAQ